MTFRFEPVGQCIYCGTTEGPLSREHIIALGLGGQAILPKASCSGCAAITGAIEQFCLRRMFGVFRTSFGMKTRRSKERPSTLSVDLHFADGTESAVELPSSQFPASLVLPRLPPARAIRGLPDDDSPIEIPEFWTWQRQSAINKICDEKGAEGAVMENMFNPTKFSQMLAKIAHSFATAHLGVGGFEPLALDLALGRTDHINYLVGAQIFGDPDEPSKNLHEMRLHADANTGMIFVIIRLFALLGAPRYHVLVGLKEGGRIASVVQRVLNG